MARTPVHPRRNLWPLVGGQSISLFGDYLAFWLVLPVFVRDATGSATQLGLLGAIETVAILGFGFVAGVLLDRVRIRRALVLADLARMVVFILIAVAAAADAGEVWMAFGVAFVVGSMSTIFDSGLESYMPTVLPDDMLVRANTAIWISRNLAQTAGFVVAGFLLTTSSGFALAFGLDALTYAVSIVGLLLLREVRPREVVSVEPMLPAIRSGLRALWASPPLRWATGAAALTNMAFAPLAAVMTLYAEAELGIDSDQALGIFFAGFSAIGAVGVMLAPRIVRRVGLGRSVVAGGFVFGGGAMAAGLVSGPWAVIPFGIAMTGVSLVQVAFVTLRQRLTSAEVRGRVIAASRTIAYAGLPIGTILGGWIGDGIGLRQLFVGSGILISAIAAVLILGPLWQEHGPGAEPPPEAPPDAGPVDGHGPIGADPWLPMDGP